MIDSPSITVKHLHGKPSGGVSQNWGVVLDGRVYIFAKDKTADSVLILCYPLEGVEDSADGPVYVAGHCTGSVYLARGVPGPASG